MGQKEINASTLAACPGCRQCAADSEECSDELHCCDANSRCESRLGGPGAVCVKRHPECKGLSQECGGPGQLTQSCCGNAKCVASGSSGKMFCEAWAGNENSVQAPAPKETNASTLA